MKRHELPDIPLPSVRSILDTRQIRLAQDRFEKAHWWPIEVLPDEELSRRGWKLATTARDLSHLSLREAADVIHALRSCALTDEEDDHLKELLGRCPYFQYLPPLDIDVDGDSKHYEPDRCRKLAHEYALAIDAHAEKVGLGRPSWHLSNARGGMHGDLICPPEIRSAHLLRGARHMVRELAHVAKVPLLSELGRKKGERSSAVCLDDSLFEKFAAGRGQQWRLVGAKKTETSFAKRPVILQTLEALQKASPAVPCDPKKVLAAVALEEREATEVAKRIKARAERERTPSGEPLPVAGTLLPGDLELIEASPRMKAFWTTTTVDDRSLHLWRMLRTATELGADRTCLSRLAWNMPGPNKVLQENRDQRYVDQTIDSVMRNLVRREVEVDLAPAIPLPSTLDLVTGWATTAAETGRKALLSLSLAGTLLTSQLGIGTATMTALLGGGHATAFSVDSTARRSDTPKAEALREIVGTDELLHLANALAHDMEKPLEQVWPQVSPKSLNTDAEMVKALSALGALAATAKAEGKTDFAKLVHMVRRRMMSSPKCKKRISIKRHTSVCGKAIWKKPQYCRDHSCGSCTMQMIRDVLDLLELPEKSVVVFCPGFASKKAAMKAYQRGREFTSIRPRELVTVEPDGTWSLTMICDAEHRGAVLQASAASPVATRYQDLSPRETRVWIVRALLAKHVTARRLIETGLNPERIVSAYRKHLTSQRSTASIAWPSKDEIQALRIERYQEGLTRRKTLNPDAEDPDLCPCSEEVVKTTESLFEVETDTGEKILENLISPPTLAQVVAYENKEPIRFNRKRRCTFRGMRRE